MRMNSIDKKMWLDQHGYARCEDKNPNTGEINVQWSIFFNAARFTGTGITRYQAYGDLYDKVKDTMYDLYCERQ